MFLFDSLQTYDMTWIHFINIWPSCLPQRYFDERHKTWTAPVDTLDLCKELPLHSLANLQFYQKNNKIININQLPP